MKKILMFIALLMVVVLKSQAAFAGYCVVTTESDNKNNAGSLRAKIEKTYNSANPNCTPPANSTDSKFFNQVVIFQTEHLAQEGFEIDNITLGSADSKNKTITFSNTSKTLVIGNWAPDVYEDSTIDLPADKVSSYRDAYSTALKANEDFGRMVIDARTNFDSGKSPFVCAPNTKPVYFRHVLIKTNNVPKSSLGACIKDGGDLLVEPGNTEVLCGDDKDNDSDGKSDCDDTDCDASDACKDVKVERECDDDKDNDGDGMSDCQDTDCFDEEICNENGPKEDCGKIGDEDNNGDADCDDAECEHLPSCDDENGGSLVEIECADNDDDDGDTLVDCEDPDCENTIECEGEATPENCTDADNVDEDKVNGANCADDVSCADEPKCNMDTEEGADCSDNLDNDRDGLIDADDDNCTPEPTELCNDDQDNDTDELVDCDDSDCADDEACSDANTDGDGDNVSPGAGDCDDEDASVYPGNKETCDSKDNNCNSKVDEGCVGADDEDDDGDGFCESTEECASTDLKTGDCDDSDPTIHPEAAEVCNDNKDNDCDGQAVDQDADGGAIAPDAPACTENVPEGGNKASGSGGCGCDLSGQGSSAASKAIISLIVLLGALMPLTARARKL